MALCSIVPVTTSRDWNDVIKFPGRFNTVEYEHDDYPYDLIHRIQWAPAGGGTSPLDPMHLFVVIKNMSKVDQVQFHCWPAISQIEVDVVIEPEQMIAFPDLSPMTVMTIQSLGGSDCECEIFQIGYFTDEDDPQ